MRVVRYRGLGQTPPTTLRSFDELPKEGERHGDIWALVSDQPTLQALRTRLSELRGLSPQESDTSLAENGALVTGLKNFWIRASSDPDLWPGIHSHQWYNFGPTNNTDGVGQIRINRRMWDLLNAADTLRPWKETDRGFIRIRANDPLMSIIRDRLQALGYIDASVGTSVQDNSAFVQALYTYWNELATIGVDGGAWPSGYNFGPNDGEKLRISAKLLNSLVNTQDNPRRAVAVAGFTSSLASMRTKPPIVGSVGSSSPSTALRTPSPSLRLALTGGQAQVSVSASNLAKIRSLISK